MLVTAWQTLGEPHIQRVWEKTPANGRHPNRKRRRTIPCQALIPAKTGICGRCNDYAFLQ